MSAVLLDNDIVLKISRYSLVDEFLAVCTLPNATFVLPTLKYVFHLDSEAQALKRIGGESALQSMRNFLDAVDELQVHPSAEILAYFQDINQIDAGEAVLFSVSAMWDQSITITGDKRALMALAKLSQEIGFSDMLSGRLKCLEQSIAEIMLAGYSDQVISKIQGEHWDTALRICFSPGDFDNAIDSLLSYYRDLNNKCFGMLSPFPDVGLT